MATNHRPVVKGMDDGTWRRIHPTPFTKRIDNPQRDFRERFLVPELSGILNWALEGLMNYLRRGLHPPRTVLAATEEYRQDMDIVGRWIEECCDLDPAAKEPTRSLYNAFAIWAEHELGWTNLSSTKFARELSEREFRKEKGTGGVRCTLGLRLKPDTIRQTMMTWGR